MRQVSNLESFVGLSILGFRSWAGQVAGWLLSVFFIGLAGAALDAGGLLGFGPLLLFITLPYYAVVLVVLLMGLWLLAAFFLNIVAALTPDAGHDDQPKRSIGSSPKGPRDGW